MAEEATNHYLKCTNALWDKWAYHLSHTQFIAAGFILQRTVRFNKTAEIIPRRHVLRGIPNTGMMGIDMSYRTWLRCLRVLETEGLIQTERSEMGLAIEIIFQRLFKGPKGCVRESQG